ncbi:MAG: biotin/lipoyl-binding protein [Candidatus Aminicenantes bacterium]|nr:biotin/lipoyl-binding protein [Candidatus Aminicenantes bacterium]
MKYTAILNDKEREVEITRQGPHQFHVIVDGQPHEVDARHCSSGWFSILIDNTSHDIYFTLDKENVELNFRSQNFNIKVLDERKMRMRRIRSDLDISGTEIIKTSMPGKVVKVLVKEGETVKSGAGIIIIEAMKMENEIQCRNSGVVKTIHVAAGQTVESDAALIEIEPEQI